MGGTDPARLSLAWLTPEHPLADRAMRVAGRLIQDGHLLEARIGDPGFEALAVDAYRAGQFRAYLDGLNAAVRAAGPAPAADEGSATPFSAEVPEMK